MILTGEGEAAAPAAIEPGRGRSTALLLGFVLAAAGSAAVIAGIFLPWYDYEALPGSVDEPAGSRLATWLLCAVVVVLTLSRRTRPWRTGSAAWRPAPLLAPAGLVVAVLWRLEWLMPLWPLDTGGILAASGSLSALLGWLLLTAAPPWRYRMGERPPEIGPWRAAAGVGGAVTAVVTAAAVAGGVLMGVAADRQVVLRSYGRAAAGTAPAAPAKLSRIRWHTTLRDYQKLAAVSGPYVLVGGEDGVRVLNAADGTERWHYVRRHDRYELAQTMLTPDGRTVVAVYGLGERHKKHSTLVIGLDVATGHTRWQWSRAVQPGGAGWSDGFRSDSWRAVAGRVLLKVDSTGGTFQSSVSVRAYDLRTGRPAWTRRLGGAGADCRPVDAEEAVGQRVLAVNMACEHRRSRQEIWGIGLTRGGKVLWRHAVRTSARLDGGTYGGAFLVQWGPAPPAGVLLDAATGRELVRGPVADGFDTVPLLTAARDAGVPDTLTAVDPKTGAKRWSRQGPEDIHGAVADDTYAYLASYAPGAAQQNSRLYRLALGSGRIRENAVFPGHGVPDRLHLADGALIAEMAPQPEGSGFRDPELYAIG